MPKMPNIKAGEIMKRKMDREDRKKAVKEKEKGLMKLPNKFDAKTFKKCQTSQSLRKEQEDGEGACRELV